MKISVLEYELPIKITPQKAGGYVANCTIWSDCYAQGDSIDEVVFEITGVAQSLIELYKEEEMKIPLKKASKEVNSASFTIPIVVEA